MNFYKRYMGDFAKKTAHLNMTETGAYDRMLDHYYAMQRALPSDRLSLYQITRAMSALERKAVDRVADEFFPINGDGLRHNKRADIEIVKHEAQASKNREIGKRGGRPKKTESDSESETESETESDSESEPNRKPNRKPNCNPTRIAYGRAKPEAREVQDQKPCPADAGFLRFWQTWPRGPRKQARGKCLVLWRKKKLEASADAIVAHVEFLKATEQWRNGVIPLPKTYLNDERWDGAETTPVPEEKRMVI